MSAKTTNKNKKGPKSRVTAGRTLSVRINQELLRRFMIILSVNNDTAIEFFRRSQEQFVKSRYKQARELLDITQPVGNIAARRRPASKQTDTKVLTVRSDDELLTRRFMSILALYDETATDHFIKLIENYVEGNFQKAMDFLDLKRKNPSD